MITFSTAILILLKQRRPLIGILFGDTRHADAGHAANRPAVKLAITTLYLATTPSGPVYV